MSTILVTGGAGFIGTHLVKKLREEGHTIYVMDAPFDVTKKADWKFCLIDVDYIIHLAGYLDQYYEDGKADFSKYVDVNVKSVALMFEVIAEQKLPIKKIIVASSQSVYGDYPMEEHEVLSPTPISMYGASKAAMEDVLLTLGKIYEIPVAALRYSIVLGHGQKFKDLDSRIVPAFVEMAKQGEIITHEDGFQKRDFINIHDLVDAHVLFLEKGVGIFNVGSGKWTEVIEVANYIAEKFGVKVSSNGKKRINTARNQLMNIDKIKSLGWAPRLGWKEAVDEFIQSASS